ncbi:MAG: T9SS type A sorting domain-containing protein, partial [Ignavibacteriaceae bacterium]|nr:T9SS type A sorting domain-containing protein [Ignavibacteriaceae bacterium]
STKIKYEIPASLNPSKGGTLVQLIVYDILGREIAVLVNEEKHPGNYEIEFDGSNLSSGIYLYRLTAGGFSATKKLVLLK